MATKKQKRELGEMRAKQEAEERRQSGLAAQKADREQREERQRNKLAEDFMRNGRLRNTRARIGIDPDTNEPFDDDEQKYLARKSKLRTAFLDSGMNPLTGMPFTDDEMTEMEQKANTPERRHLFERIRAGRAGLIEGGTEATSSTAKRMGAPELMSLIAKKNNASGIPLHTNNQLYAMERKKNIESQDYDPFHGMTVGEFRDKMDEFYTGMGWNL
jgi:hypothetical protein